MQRGFKKVGMLGVLSIGLVFSTAAWAAEAWPYKAEVNFGPSPHSYAVVRADRKAVGVCDMQQDGMGVYGRFKLANGETREVETFTWEKLDYVDKIKRAFGL